MSGSCSTILPGVLFFVTSNTKCVVRLSDSSLPVLTFGCVFMRNKKHQNNCTVSSAQISGRLTSRFCSAHFQTCTAFLHRSNLTIIFLFLFTDESASTFHHSFCSVISLVVISCLSGWKMVIDENCGSTKLTPVSGLWEEVGVPSETLCGRTCKLHTDRLNHIMDLNPRPSCCEPTVLIPWVLCLVQMLQICNQKYLQYI